jgi:hypothetical protein
METQDPHFSSQEEEWGFVLGAGEQEIVERDEIDEKAGGRYTSGNNSNRMNPQQGAQ